MDNNEANDDYNIFIEQFNIPLKKCTINRKKKASYVTVDY